MYSLRVIFPMALLASMLLAYPALAGESTESTPQQLVADWAATFNKNDPELLCDFYDQSGDLQVIISSGVRYRGYDAVKKAYADDHEVVRFYESEPVEISARNLGDTAIVAFEHKLKVRFLDDNTRWQVHVRTTSVLKRMGGEWKIVLEHSSPIHGIERKIQIQE